MKDVSTLNGICITTEEFHWSLSRLSVCCSVLQCVAVCCSVSQSVAECWLVSRGASALPAEIVLIFWRKEFFCFLFFYFSIFLFCVLYQIKRRMQCGQVYCTRSPWLRCHLAILIGQVSHGSQGFLMHDMPRGASRHLSASQAIILSHDPSSCHPIKAAHDPCCWWWSSVVACVAGIATYACYPTPTHSCDSSCAFVMCLIHLALSPSCPSTKLSPPILSFPSVFFYESAFVVAYACACACSFVCVCVCVGGCLRLCERGGRWRAF